MGWIDPSMKREVNIFHWEEMNIFRREERGNEGSSVQYLPVGSVNWAWARPPLLVLRAIFEDRSCCGARESVAPGAAVNRAELD